MPFQKAVITIIIIVIMKNWSFKSILLLTIKHINDYSGLHRVFIFFLFSSWCINKEWLRAEGSTKTQTKRIMATLSVAMFVLFHSSVLIGKELSVSVSLLEGLKRFSCLWNLPPSWLELSSQGSMSGCHNVAAEIHSWSY